MNGAGEAYRRALARLLALPDYERMRVPGGAGQGSVPFNLERPRALLQSLGNPQVGLPTVLIAGSKGKGSTAALLESILRAHGWSTALYTQPHLVDYRERIRLDGRLIEPALFATCAEWVAAAAERVAAEHSELGLATTYEQTTAIALLAARDWRADWTVLEVGLGGRLDATNLSDPLVSAITPIGLEHRAILGNTLGEIAAEKAAIMRPGRPAVAASQDQEALEVIRSVAAQIGARLEIAPTVGQPEVQAVPEVVGVGSRGVPPRFWTIGLSTRRRHYQGLELGLGGEFQVGNLATALYTLEALPGVEDRLEERRVRAGVAATRWPGRLEVVRAARAPLVVLDGAHTPESAAALVAAMRLHFRWKRLTTVFACLDDKDAEALLLALTGLGGGLIVTQTDHPRSRGAHDLQRVARALGLEAAVALTTAEALAEALSGAHDDDLVLVTGSLSIVGEARRELGLAVE